MSKQAKERAEKDGWVFQPIRYRTVEVRQEVPEYAARKLVGGTWIDRAYDSEEKLLEEIARYEGENIPVAEAADEPLPELIPLPNKDMFPEEHEAAKALVADGVDWREDPTAVFGDRTEKVFGKPEGNASKSSDREDG